MSLDIPSVTRSNHPHRLKDPVTRSKANQKSDSSGQNRLSRSHNSSTGVASGLVKEIMSARRPEGAMGRPELFQAANKQGAEVPQQRSEFKGEAKDDDEPLQLEHMMGYSGKHLSTVVAMPNDENRFIKSMGNLVCIENLLDPHDQKFMRGHDMPISAVAASPSGNFIATGQEGTVRYKGMAAPIFVWDALTGEKLATLKGLSIKVTAISFSADERFICGTGEDMLLYVWDASSGEVALGSRTSAKVDILKFVNQRRDNHYIAYELVVGYGSVVAAAFLTFDPSRVQWNLKLVNYAVSSGGGLVREYRSIDTSADSTSIYTATSAGEMMVYAREAGVFRAAIPVCTAGMNALCVLDDGRVVCGGGDCSLKVLAGDGDLSWELEKETKFEAPIRNLAKLANGVEVIVVLSNGSVYRCSMTDMRCTIVGSGHTAEVTCMAISEPVEGSATYFASGASTGELRVWDIADYACLAVTSFPKSGAVLSVCMVGNHSVITGYEDGFIRCHDTATLNRQLWYIPTAHRGGCSTLAVHVGESLQYFISGGADSSIRVWRLANREMVTQYLQHTHPIVALKIDDVSPNIVHSVSMDATVLSYDLKAAKRIMSHMVTNGQLTGVTQRKDSERELVTCDNQGRLLHWDIDVRDPVVAVQDPGKLAIKVCSVSPSGRYLAFAGDDQLVKVLEIGSTSVVSVGQAHSGSISCLTWTNDERQVITGGLDTCICVFNFYLAEGDASAEAK